MSRQAISTADRFLHRALAWVAGLLLALVFLLGIYQVGARFVFEEPSTWSEVATRMAMIWMALMSVPLAYRHGALAAMTFFAERVGERGAPVLRVAIHGISLATMAILIWSGMQLVERMSWQTLAGIDISIAYAFAAIPVGFGLTCISALLLMLGAGEGENREPIAVE